MGGSLYSITDELRAILNSAMENDGEISQEEFDKLTITEQNFREKIEDYCKAIFVNKYDVDACKCEKKRINDGQQVKNNFIERLKAKLLDAVVEFGQTKEGKNGTTYTIEAGTFKLFTKNLIKFIANEYRTNLLKDTLLSYFKELFINKVLVADDFAEKGDEEDEVNAMLGAINAIAKSRFESDVEDKTIPLYLADSEWIDFTIEDLKALNINFTFGLSGYDLITDGTYIAQAYCNELGLLGVSTEVKPITELDNITIGENTVTQSLTIK